MELTVDLSALHPDVRAAAQGDGPARPAPGPATY